MAESEISSATRKSKDVSGSASSKRDGFKDPSPDRDSLDFPAGNFSSNSTSKERAGSGVSRKKKSKDFTIALGSSSGDPVGSIPSSIRVSSKEPTRSPSRATAAQWEVVGHLTRDDEVVSEPGEERSDHDQSEEEEQQTSKERLLPVGSSYKVPRGRAESDSDSESVYAVTRSTQKRQRRSPSASDSDDVAQRVLEDDRQLDRVEAANSKAAGLFKDRDPVVIQTTAVVTLEALGPREVQKFEDYCRGLQASNRSPNWTQLVKNSLLEVIVDSMASSGIPKTDLNNLSHWSVELFFSRLYQTFQSLKSSAGELTVEGQIRATLPEVEAFDNGKDLKLKVVRWVHRLRQILGKEYGPSTSRSQQLKRIIRSTMQMVASDVDIHRDVKSIRVAMRKAYEDARPADVLSAFTHKLIDIATEFDKQLTEAAKFGMTISLKDAKSHHQNEKSHQSKEKSHTSEKSHYSKEKSHHSEKPHHSKEKSSQHTEGGNKRKHDSSAPKRLCRGCGNRSHNTEDCYGKGNRQILGYNHDPAIEWIDSPAAKEHFPELSSLPMEEIWKVIPKTSKPDKGMSKRKHKGESASSIKYQYVMHLNSGENLYGSTWPVTIALPGTNDSYNINALFDSGALQANYGSLALQDRLEAEGLKPSPCGDIVCSAFGECRRCRSQFFLFVTLINDLGQHKVFPIVAKIIDIEFDLIIGRPTILAHKLESIVTAVRQDNSHIENVCLVTEAEGEPKEASVSRTDGYLSTTSATRPHANNTIHMSQIFPHEDTDYLDDEFLDRATWWETEDLEEVPVVDLPNVHIEGPPSLQEKLMELVREFRDIFDVNPSKEPALLPPMELEVDKGAWQCSRNRTPPRPQTLEKQKEIMRQIEQMKERGIIVESQATEFSQVLLQPKPGNKWRFCIDYRSLNLVSKGAGWPIPVISMLLQRVGSKRAKFFGVMDPTSGYHQMPMSKMAQIFTAFITFMGVFEFTRVPFGLKGAPSYFQQLMATVVLAGLIYIICEVYLDDIIVYATTEEEFISHLKKTFERLRKFSVKLHPEKTKLGMSSIEYVGHVIDENGLSFSQVKREKVLDCPKPTKQKHMKSFLGVANYFRDHIRDYATMVHPLQEMIRNYTRSQSLKWSPAADQAWDNIRAAINECPKLFFLNSQAPVYLHTDASAYGIGAYLFQIVEGKPQPIAFVSKALSSQQRLKWTVPEKEAYAIYYSFQKLEYLIRDVEFTLRTDHQNLTFLTQAGSRRVLTWKLAIQEFNFNIEYIKGPDNFVADCFSRELMDSGDDPEQDIVRIEKLNTLFHKSVREPIPPKEYNLISGVHNSFVGHHGEERTMQKLIRKGQEWPNMRKHVKSFIKACPACQKMSYKSHIINAKPFTLARYEPMERINVDSIGPLPEDKWGNKYIITMIDCFTRFVELYPVPDTTAEVAARALLHFVGRYGSPAEIMSDNGSQYVNKLIAEFCRLIGTEHPTSLAYSHEENGIVERANKEIQRHLKHILFDRNVFHDWSDCLPIVQRIINTTTHESIGISPSQILFGNAISVDRGIFLPHDTRSREDETSTPFDTQHRGTMEFSEWADKMLARQASLIELAQSYQAQADSDHISASKPKRRSKSSTVVDETASVTHITEFPVDSYVLVSYPRSSFGNRRPPNKLMANLRGPLRVVSNVGSTYSVQDLVTNKLESVHVTQLRPFEYDPHRVEPRLIANKDQQMWEVDEIIAHRGSAKKRSAMTFRVRWTGFTEDDDTWEPWKNLRKNLKLHAYLRKSNLTALLPRPGEDEDT